VSTNDPLSAYLPSEVRHLFATGRANDALVEQPSWPIHKCNNQIFPKSSRAAAAAMAMTNNMTTILVMNKRTIVKSNVALWNKTVTAPICFDENDEAFGNDLLSNAVRIQLSFQTASVSGANVLLLAVVPEQLARPACRQPWQHDEDDCVSGRQGAAAASSSSNKRGAVNEEGYVNLGSLQGQSPQRDTSMYYNSPWRRGGGVYYYNGSSNKRSRRRN
jgi:hypothetical protein